MVCIRLQKVIQLAVIEINRDNLEAEFLKSELPAVMDFWGPGCGPCMAMMPKYHELADNPKYAGRSLRVMSLPTFLFYKGGKEVARLSGKNTAIETITAKLEELI